MNEETILILRQILRTPVKCGERKESIETGNWEFNDDGTVQVYAGKDIQLWYYLHKDFIFRTSYDESELLDINSL